jgi:hypothetical protein
MASSTRDVPSSRYAAIAAVVVLHLVLMSIAKRLGTLWIVDVPEGDALILVPVDRPAPPPRPAEPDPAPKPQIDVRAPAPTQSTQAFAPVTPSPPRQIDWRGNALRSAEKVAGSSGSVYRSFGPRKAPESGEPAPPALFDTTPKHKYGDVGELGGRPVVWMSANCYTELDAVVRDARDRVLSNSSSFAAPAINCVGSETGQFRLVMPNPSSFTPLSLNYSRAIGKREVDGTLFEHIKKPEEPPVPKAGTEMNELPERVEEP